MPDRNRGKVHLDVTPGESVLIGPLMTADDNIQTANIAIFQAVDGVLIIHDDLRC